MSYLEYPLINVTLLDMQNSELKLAKKDTGSFIDLFKERMNNINEGKLAQIKLKFVLNNNEEKIGPMQVKIPKNLSENDVYKYFMFLLIINDQIDYSSQLKQLGGTILYHNPNPHKPSKFMGELMVGVKYPSQEETESMIEDLFKHCPKDAEIMVNDLFRDSPKDAKAIIEDMTRQTKNSKL